MIWYFYEGYWGYEINLMLTACGIVDWSYIECLKHVNVNII